PPASVGDRGWAQAANHEVTGGDPVVGVPAVGPAEPVARQGAPAGRAPPASPERRFRRTVIDGIDLLTVLPGNWATARSLYRSYVRAAKRLIRDQAEFRGVGPSLSGKDELVVWVHGVKATLRPETEDLHFLRPRHKLAVSRWFRPRPGEYVVDVGAHLGYWSLLAASKGATVDSVEANPSLGALLERSRRLNGIVQGRVLSVAAGAAHGSVPLYVPGRYDGTASLHREWPKADPRYGLSTIVVPVMPLDAIVLPGRAVDWLLVDVEGGEPEVLAGASGVLARTKRVLLEVSDGPTVRECEAALRAVGLEVKDRFRESGRTEYWFARRGGI
ncbi:MAG TPA: FkbM family methyltransferase, partial [Thermoplasmata archaeon]|nr:FkbM family methyltransferase [Thermoplasmata archaeon]